MWPAAMSCPRVPASRPSRRSSARNVTCARRRSALNSGSTAATMVVSAVIATKTATTRGFGMTALPLVDDNLAFFQHDLRFQHFVDVQRRIAVDQDDVGELACLERADLIGHADVARGVEPDDAVNVGHREHDAVRLQLV